MNKEKTIYLSIKYLRDGKFYQGVCQLTVKRELGVRKSVKEFLDKLDMVVYKYRTFDTMKKAAMCYIE